MDHADDAATVAMPSAAGAAISSAAAAGGERSLHLVICAPGSIGAKVVGAAILWLPSNDVTVPLSPMLEAIAEALRNETAREALG